MNKAIVVFMIAVWLLVFEITYLVYFLYNLVFKFSIRGPKIYLELIEQYSKNLEI